MLVQEIRGGRSINYYKIFATIMFALSVVTVNTVFINQASATSQNHKTDKVTICHRTNSVKKPYVSITIDKKAYDGQHSKSNRKSDHYGEHKGPIVISEEQAKQLKQQKTKWGDIYIEDSPRGGNNKSSDEKKNYSDDCVVGSTEPKKEHTKDKEHKEDKPKNDECKDEEIVKDEDVIVQEPKVEEDKVVVETQPKQTVDNPKVLAEVTVAQPQELAKTGVNPVVASLIGLIIISTVGLLFRKSKPVANKDFDYTI